MFPQGKDLTPTPASPQPTFKGLAILAVLASQLDATRVWQIRTGWKPVIYTQVD